DAAVAEHHRGDAVPARGREQRVPHGLAVVVGVHVDPPGRHQETVSVDLAPPGPLLAPDPDDARPRDGYVSGERRLAGAVDDGAAANDDVVHGERSWIGCRHDAPAEVPAPLLLRPGCHVVVTVAAAKTTRTARLTERETTPARPIDGPLALWHFAG